MPPRYAYWTILLEGKPTAFRAHTRDELLPTLRQLQTRHPDAVMLWFARGRLWQSPEEERAAAQARRMDRERRDPGWRPGGEHRDPRDRFKVPRDEKRRRFAAKLRRDRESGEGRPARQRPENTAWRSRGPRSQGAGGRGDRKPGGRGRGPGGGHGPGGRGGAGGGGRGSGGGGRR